METLRFVVYGLVDPRNGHLRYVGLHTGDPAKRLREHLCLARKGKKLYVYDWIRQVLRAKLKPEIIELEVCSSESEMIEAEGWHIAYWRFLGCRLTNLTNGGEGALGYRHSDEAKKKMSAVKKGVKWSTETRQAMIERGLVVSSGQEDEIISAYLSGKSLNEIGVLVGLSGGGVRKILMRRKVLLRKPWAVGPKRGPASKLSSTQQREVVELYTQGRSSVWIGKKFGVSDSAVRRCLRNQKVEMRSATSQRWISVRNGWVE